MDGRMLYRFLIYKGLYAHALFGTLIVYTSHSRPTEDNSVSVDTQRHHLQTLLMLALFRCNNASSMKGFVRQVTSEFDLSGDRRLISFLSSLFPGAAIDERWNAPPTIDVLLDHVDPEIPTSLAQVGTLRFFQTTRGCLGLGYHRLRKGDLVCALKVYDIPVTLWHEDSFYLHVGSCFVRDWRLVQKVLAVATLSYIRSRWINRGLESCKLVVGLVSCRFPEGATEPSISPFSLAAGEPSLA